MHLLILSILISFGNVFSIKCIPKLVSWFLDDNNEVRKIMTEISLLKEEQSDVSIVKQFAKHAKLQRKINKLNEELKKYKRENESKNFKIKLTWKVSLYVISIILNFLFVCYNYRQTVLNELPYNLFSPLSWLVSWPMSQVGTMSFLFWYGITNCVAKVTTSNI